MSVGSPVCQPADWIFDVSNRDFKMQINLENDLSGSPNQNPSLHAPASMHSHALP
jgi:hypothetical protein